MEYDPYYADQYAYYGDPYADYGYDPYGYDPYGYGYNDAYVELSPLPKPDKNWVDPVQVNKEYLKKIQNSCIHKGFEELRDDGLFLLEVLARSVSINKELVENQDPPNEKDLSLKIYIKFLDMQFVEVNGFPNQKLVRESKDSSELSSQKSFDNLFQSIYTATGRHDSLIPEEEDDLEGKEFDENREKRKKESNANIPNEDNPIEQSNETEEKETIKVMKGKSVLTPMPGIFMIQKLQQYPLIMKVVRYNATDELTKVEDDTLGIASFRVPETFRKAVLMACKPASILPIVAVTTNYYKLMDQQGVEVGDVELTLALTCFGKGAVNCMTELKNNRDYDHPFLLKHLKARLVVGDGGDVPYVDPRLAEEILKMGLFHPHEKTSSEILQHCLSSNLIPGDEQDLRHAQKKNNCDWFAMVKKVRSSSSTDSSYEKYYHDLEMERAALWMKHKQICRDLKEKESLSKRSLYDRLYELQVQTGVTGMETRNPFEELAQTSHSPKDAESFRSRTPSTSLRNSK